MSYIQPPLFIIYECLWFSWGAQVTREFRSSQNLQGIVEGQVADRPPVAPGDKTSRRLQSTLAEAFKPLETFDCPGTVSLIGFNLKSFTQIAKRCIFSTKLISSRCYRCWWFHVSYFHHQRIIWAPIMTLSFFLSIFIGRSWFHVFIFQLQRMSTTTEECFISESRVNDRVCDCPGCEDEDQNLGAQKVSPWHPGAGC